MQSQIRFLAALLIFVAAAQANEGRSQSREIVVSIPDRKLALIEAGSVVKVYPTAVGRAGSPTPVGRFTIINRITDPAWYGRRQVIEPGPDNPLGTRWIGLDRKHYGIHGTNEPDSIGRSASHGCVRMLRADVEELFEMVSVGDAVEFSDQPFDEILSARRAPTEEESAEADRNVD